MIVLAIAVSMFAVPYVSAASGFDTNMDGWTGTESAIYGQETSPWTLGDNGYTVDASAGKKGIAKSNLTIDGQRSFTYEVTFKKSAYGAGLTFATNNNGNFIGIEIGGGSVYCMKMDNGNWSGWSDTVAVPDSEVYTLRVEYVHSMQFLLVYVNDVLYIYKADFGGAILAGNLGLYAEDGTATFTGAKYTAGGDGFVNNMGTWTTYNGSNWEVTEDGLSHQGWAGGKEFAFSEVAIDPTKSFTVEYVLGKQRDTHAAAMIIGFAAADAYVAYQFGNSSGISGEVFIMKINPAEGANFINHKGNVFVDQPGITASMFATLKLEYDHKTGTANFYYNGELTFAVENFDTSLFSGNFGVVTESGRSYLLSATYTEIQDAPLAAQAAINGVQGVQPADGVAGGSANATITEGANVTVLGWVLTNYGLSDVKYSIDGAEGVSFTNTRERPDVIAHLVGTGFINSGATQVAPGKVGFGNDTEHAVIDTSALAAGNHTIKLVAYSDSGEAVEFYTINLTVEAAQVTPPENGDFGLISLAFAAISTVVLKKKKEN